MSSPVLRRVVRRETHSPRTVAMIVAVIVVILALVYVGTEIVLSVLGQPALLLGPAAAFTGVVGLPTDVPAGISIAAGVVMALIGLILIVLAVKPGRLPKHALTPAGDAREDRAIVADNGVIAASVAQRISENTGLMRDQVRVGVAHRRVDVTITPGFGEQIDRDEIRRVTDAELQSYGLAPAVRTTVRVEQKKDEVVR